MPPLLRRDISVVVRALSLSILAFSFNAQKHIQPKVSLPPVLHAVRLLDWLCDIVQIGDGIRRVVGLLLSERSLQWPSENVGKPLRPIPAEEGTPQSSTFSWLALMLEIDGADKLPPQLQRSIHSVYFQLITDLVFKRIFLDKFVHNYERYIHAQLQSKLYQYSGSVSRSQETRLHIDIVEDFTVQLFTVPALVPVMIRRGGLLDVLIDLLLRLFESTALPVTPYATGVPYAQSAFANEFQSSASRTPSNLVPSSSTAPPAQPTTTLPLPFSCAESPPKEAVNEQASAAPQSRRGLSELIVGPGADPSSLEGRPGVRFIWRPATRTPEGTQTQPTAEEATESPATPMQGTITNNGTEQETREQPVSPDMEDEPIQFPNIITPTQGQGINPFPDDTNAMAIAFDENGEIGVVADGIEFGPDNIEHANGQRTVFPGHALLVQEVERVANNLMNRTTPDEDDPMEDVESNGGRDEAARSAQRNLREQLAVFEDCLSRVARRERRLSSSEIKESRLVAAVKEARGMEEAAFAGTGPLAHTMRLGWVQGQDKKISDLVCWRVVNDLKYVLTHQLVAFHLVHIRPDLFRKFVRIMSIAQGMNWASRRFKQHVPMERDTWAESFTIEIEFFYYVELLAAAFCGPKPSSMEAALSDLEEASAQVDLPASRLRCISIVRSCLDEWLDREEALESRSIYAGEKFTNAHAVSVHLPLHRLLAFLVHHVLRLDGISLPMALSGGVEFRNSPEYTRRLMRHPLRVQVFLSQVRAGMWRRNGHPVEGQSMFYSSVLCSEWFVDLDLFLQQCCAGILKPDAFMREVLEGFRIGNFAAIARVPNSKLKDEDPKENGEEGQGENLWSRLILDSDSSRADVRDDDMGRVENPRRGNIWRRLTREGGENGTTVSATNLGAGGCQPVKSVRALGFLPLAPKRYSVKSLFSSPTIVDAGNTVSELAGFTPTLVEDMLVYMVRVTSERCRCGANEAEILRRKLLHQLCSRDRTYSQLYRACSYRICNELEKAGDLSDEPSEEVNKSDALVDATLASIADYVAPKGMEQGRYKLKDELWQEFDPFTPHMIPRERCAAEVRHASVCQMLNKKMQVIPSQLISQRTIMPQLQGLADLCVSLSLPHAVATEMLRAALPQHGGPNSLEGGISAALHLICAAVESKEANRKDSLYCMNESLPGDNFSGSAIGVVCEMYLHATRPGSTLYSEFTPVLERILVQANHRGSDRVRQLLGEKVPNLLPRDSPNGVPTNGSSSAEQSPEQERRKALLRKKKEQQAAAMARMRLAQANFAKHIDQSEADGVEGSPDSKVHEESIEDEPNRIQPTESDMPKVKKARGPGVSKDHAGEECALCHDVGSGDGTRLLGLIGFHQNTRLPTISRRQCSHPALDGLETVSSLGGEIEAVYGTGTFIDRTWGPKPSKVNEDESTAMEIATFSHVDRFDSFFLNADMLNKGVESSKNLYLSFCGHAIHIHCFERYFASLLQSRANETVYEGYNVLNLDRMEFLCPVCRRLANMVLPLMNVLSEPAMASDSTQQRASASCVRYSDWIEQRNLDICHESNPGLSDPRLNFVKAPSKQRVQETSAELSTTVNTFRLKVISRGRAVLQRFGLQSFNSPQNKRNSEPKEEDDSASFGSYTKLPSAVISTVACTEIAARSESWGGTSSHVSQRSLGTVVREARSQISLEVGPRRLGLFQLWKAVRSSRLETSVDPFAAFCFLFLLWPGPLTFSEVKNIVRLCYDLIRHELLRSDCTRSTATQIRLDSRNLLFLRRATVLVSSFFESLESPPLVAYRPNGSDATIDEIRREISVLMQYFDIPKSKELPSNLDASSLFCSRLEEFNPRRIGLIKLPRLFQSLLEGLDGSVCSGCNKTPKGAALCLVCGDVLCASRTSCTAGRLPLVFVHADKCGAGIGVFLILKITCVQLFRKDRTTIWGSPYLDAHGEEDKKFVRGKPLILNRERYASLERLWLTHGFDLDSRILTTTVLRPFQGLFQG